MVRKTECPGTTSVVYHGHLTTNENQNKSNSPHRSFYMYIPNSVSPISRPASMIFDIQCHASRVVHDLVGGSDPSASAGAVEMATGPGPLREFLL